MNTRLQANYIESSTNRPATTTTIQPGGFSTSAGPPDHPGNTRRAKAKRRRWLRNWVRLRRAFAAWGIARA